MKLNHRLCDCSLHYYSHHGWNLYAKLQQVIRHKTENINFCVVAF